ncbi:MAG: glycosyltransferase [Phycisphaerales bacterium]|nr:glycosyltransferase [Phycisphaerales bacterium]MCB9863410.1 glycosyltransferase [Phycisphaerales bacterium]
MNRIRVLYLATDLQRGGLPLRLCNLVRRLASEGIEPIVGCLAGRGPLNDALEADGIETFHCDARGGWDPTCLLRFAQVVLRINPDLIHASLFHANLAARLCGRIDRSRPVITSTVTIEVERAWHRRIEALTCGLSSMHVANSPAVATHLIDELGFPPGLVREIPNGIDIEAIDAAPPISRASYRIRNDAPMIVWAGRMDPVKNLDTLVEAIRLLRSTRDVQAVFVGDGPDRGRIQTLVETLGLAPNVHFVGWSDNVAGWLKSADVLVFPSRTEGCPNVVLEAMAARCPIVASRIAAHEAILAKHDMALRCRWNSADEFASGVRSVLDECDLSRRVETARVSVEAGYSLANAASRWLRCYCNLLSGGAAPLHDEFA